jgi:hypothetical protein
MIRWWCGARGCSVVEVAIRLLVVWWCGGVVVVVVVMVAVKCNFEQRCDTGLHLPRASRVWMQQCGSIEGVRTVVICNG